MELIKMNLENTQETAISQGPSISLPTGARVNSVFVVIEQPSVVEDPLPLEPSDNDTGA